MHEGQRERIFSGSFLQVFPPQLTLFELGQRPDFLHVLVDGLVELYAHSAGRDTTMRIVEPVTSFILAAVVTDQPYLMSARTLVASRILLVPAALVREVVKDDCALMQATMRELAQAYRGMVRALDRHETAPVGRTAGQPDPANRTASRAATASFSAQG
jgi:CRP/FNR family transcriptional activator FtrB